MKTDKLAEGLAEAASVFAAHGARNYLQAHNLKPVSDETLAQSIKSWIAVKMPEALADTKAAMECGMTDIAQTTFGLSMMQAGIEAAKEASAPVTL